MFQRFKDKMAGGANTLPLSLLLFVMIWGGLILIPTSVSLRDQRIENISYALFMATGFYIFRKISKTAGLMVLWTGAISVMSFIYATDTFFTIFACMILFIGITLNYGQIKDYKTKIYDCMIIIVTINVIFQVMQRFGIYYISYPVPGTEMFLCGLMNNVNDVSALYAILLPAFLRKNRLYLLPVVLLGLYLSVTLNGVLASFCVLTIYAIVKTKRAAVAYSIVAVALSTIVLYSVYIDKTDYQSQKNGRLYFWQKTIEIANIKTLGWGINQYDKIMPLLTSFKYIDKDMRQAAYGQIYDKANFDKALRKISNNDLSYFNKDTLKRTYFVQAHNEYVEWYFIAGPIGVIFLFFFLARYLYISFRQDDMIPFYGLFAACMTAVFFFTWHIAPTILFTVLYLGLIRGERNV